MFRLLEGGGSMPRCMRSGAAVQRGGIINHEFLVIDTSFSVTHVLAYEYHRMPSYRMGVAHEMNVVAYTLR